MMYLKKGIGIFVVIVVCVVLEPMPVFSEDLKLKLSYGDTDLFPYEVGEGTQIADPPGMNVELIVQAAKEIGLDIDLVRWPSKRMLVELEAGHIDGIFCYSFRQERVKFGLYPMKNGKVDGSRRLATIGYFLYKLKDASIDWDGQQFTRVTKPIGFNRGYSIGEDIQEKGVPVQEATNTIQNLKKLRARRIGAFAGFDVSTDNHVESGKYGDIFKFPIPLASKDYFLLLSYQFVSKNPEKAKQLWDKISELRDRMLKKLPVKYYYTGGLE